MAELPAAFPQAVWRGIEDLLAHRRVTAVATLLGLFGITASPVFNLEPRWIGPATVGLVVTALLVGGAYRAWINERSRRLAAELKLEGRGREVALGGMFGLLLSIGNVLAERQPAPGTASDWERRVSRLIGAAYGVGEAALFSQDGGQMADDDEGFDRANTRSIISLRHKRLAELMTRTPPPPLLDSFDPDERDWVGDEARVEAD